MANAISAFVSADGVSWTLRRQRHLCDARRRRYVGLAVSSHDVTRLATATFDSVTVRPLRPRRHPLRKHATGNVDQLSVEWQRVHCAGRDQHHRRASDSDGTVARVEFFAGDTARRRHSAPTRTGGAASPPDLFPDRPCRGRRRSHDHVGGRQCHGECASTTAATAGAARTVARGDIGAVGVAGSAGANAGTFTVRGAGADVWGSADAFHYAWQQITGDADVARVGSVEYVHAWVKAGVMIREVSTRDSAHAFMLVSAGKGYAFQRRIAGGGLSTSTQRRPGTAPAWVKLERRAGRSRLSSRPDGVHLDAGRQ